MNAQHKYAYLQFKMPKIPIGQFFPEIHDASYEDKFADLVSLDGFTRLSSGIF